MKQFRETSNGIELFETRTGRIIQSSDAGELTTERAFREFKNSGELACFYSGEMHVNYRLPGDDRIYTDNMFDANDMLEDAYIELGEKAVEQMDAAKIDAPSKERITMHLELLHKNMGNVASGLIDSGHIDPDLDMEEKIKYLAESIQKLTVLLPAYVDAKG